MDEPSPLPMTDPEELELLLSPDELLPEFELPELELLDLFDALLEDE